MPSERNKTLILEITTSVILDEAKAEFKDLIEVLEGNEEVIKAFEHLCKEGYERLSTTDMNMKECVWTINQAFSEIITEFKDYISLDFYDGETVEATNIEQKIGQVIRYIDFIRCLRMFYNIQEDIDVKTMSDYAKEVKDFIFSTRPYRYPNDRDWADSFFKLTEVKGRDRAIKPGFEPYYMKGMIEFIKSMSDRERHEDGYIERFTAFNFYDDPIQVICVYNLSIYAFIEFIEAWANIRPFIEEHSGELL